MVIDEKNMPVIVGVRFSKIGKNYFFDATKIGDVKIGDHLIVETSRGWQIGELSEIITDPKIRTNTKYKTVDRLATPEDLNKKNRLAEKSDEAIKLCQKEISRLEIKGVKIITAEFSFDEKILSFIYSSSNEETPNLNSLKAAISKIYLKMRIDYHKIGPRDVAKYLGGMGACGFACRCCTKFLRNFDSISINMAKKQGISLTPSDITGMCDRLRCCLQYEYCHYVEALSQLPKKNKSVQTPKGRGKVVDVAPLTKSVFVYIEEVGVKEFQLDEISDAAGPGAVEQLPKLTISHQRNKSRKPRPKGRKE